MLHGRFWRLWLVLMSLAWPLHAEELHEPYGQLLQRHVVGGWVDYSALRGERAQLQAYLGQLAAVPQARFDAWSKPQRLAYLINLYNAATLELILDHYPLDSIKDIGGWFSGPWDQKVVSLFGEQVTLDHIEHERLRPRYNEPRIHFALVCAARSCPPLRNEAYVADRLEAQLDAQGRTFMLQTDKNRLDVAGRRVYLSKIFKWFDGDFGADEKARLSWIAQYFSPTQREQLGRGNWSIRYTDYDWRLNDAKRR